MTTKSIVICTRRFCGWSGFGSSTPRMGPAAASVETTRIPVIALTGLVFEEAKQEAIDAGCERFVAKGADLERIVQTIREVLARVA